MNEKVGEDFLRIRQTLLDALLNFVINLVTEKI